jgi:hypothetical protein
MKRGGEGALVVLMLAIFIGIGIYVSMRLNPDAPPPPPGTSVSTELDGTQALYELLKSSGMKVERYAGVEYDYPKDGCVLVVMDGSADPAGLFMGGLDAKAVRVWLEEGGRMIFAASGQAMILNSLEQELQGEAQGISRQKQLMLKYRSKGKAGSANAIWQAYKPGMQYNLPRPAPRLFGNARFIEIADSLPPPEMGTGLLYTGNPPFALLQYRKVGKGEIMWLFQPEILMNDWIARADNHRLALALIERMAKGGKVYFDEHLHGLALNERDATALVFQTQGGRLLLALAGAIALCFCGFAVSAARTAPPPVPPRRQAAEMVLAQASLYRRAGVMAATAESLVDGFRRAYMQANHLAVPPSNEAVLAWLRAAAAKQKFTGAGALMLYLEQHPALRSGGELLRLAQACDAARRLLERGV